MKPRRSFYILFVICSFCHSPPILPILVPFWFTLIFQILLFLETIILWFLSSYGWFPSKISWRSSVKNSTNHQSWSWGPFKIKFRPFLEWHAYAHSQSKLIVHLKGYLFLYAFTVARHVSWLNRLQSANLPPLNPRSKSNLWSVNFKKSGFIIFAN